MPTLGCSTHVAYITDKCNGVRICDLENASEINYNRKLDDISDAMVVIPTGGDAHNACCDCLKNVEPWCHQLTIVREGDGVVWSGPVQKVTYGRNQVTIEARDKLAWLLYRVNKVPVDFSLNGPATSTSPGSAPPYVPLTNIAMEIIRLAMGEDADEPCFIDGDPLINSCTSGCGGILNMGDDRPADFPRKFYFEAFGGPTAYDDISTLGEAGMDFTVINQTLILMSEDLPNRAIGILTDEMILGDVEVIKDGTTMGNTFWVRYEGDDDCVGTCTPQGSLICPCPGVAEGNHYCYGAIERVIDSTGAQDVDQATGIAQQYLERGEVVPRRIEFPSGTRLSPDTPWSINDMICGQRVDVALSTLCLPIFQSFKLQAVTVTDNGTDESIAVDLLAIETTDD